jgi:hypothetical protein
MKQKIAHLLLATMACSFAASMLSAATTYYKWSGSGADNNWSTATNWNGGVTPPNGNETIIQPQGTSNLAVTIDTPVSVNAIQFQGNSGAFVYSGSSITISGTGNAIHSNAPAKTQTFQSDVIFTKTTAQIIAQLGANFVFNNIALDFTTPGNIDLRPVSASTITINGAITGAGRLHINDSGTVYLTSTATATNTLGFQFLAGGTLVVDGSVTGLVDMRSTSKLAGTGSITGNVTLLGGTTFQPGSVDSAGASTTGTLGVTGNISFADGAQLMFQAGDSVTVTGNVTFAAGSTLELSGFSTVGSWQLFSVTGGSITDNGLTITGVPEEFACTFVNGLLSVTLPAPVPEPATTVLVTGFTILLAALALMRCRKN